MSLSSREKDNLTRWKDGQKGFYEVYYVKWNDPANQYAAWLRYTLLAPLASLNREPEASVWAIFFDATDPSKSYGLKKTFPVSEARIERDFFYFAAGPSAIYDAGCRGEVADSHNRFAWELKFGEPAQSLRHYPFPFYWSRFPRTKFLAPNVTMRLSGEFFFNDKKFLLDGIPAHQAHLWGTEMAHSWFWGNCNTFREDPDFWFEGFSARLNLGEKLSPPLNVLSFGWEGAVHKLGGLRHWFKNRSEGSLDRWHFEGRDGDLLFVGDLWADPKDMAGVRYEDTDGSKRYCHNTKTADLRVQIFRQKKSGLEPIKTLTASRSAAFEMVQPKLDPQVRVFIP